MNPVCFVGKEHSFTVKIGNLQHQMYLFFRLCERKSGTSGQLRIVHFYFLNLKKSRLYFFTLAGLLS